jgi:hypothetical protein
MSRHQPYRGAQRRRYQVVMKSWRRLRRNDADGPIQIRFRRRHLLEELRVLDLETYDS